MRQKPKRDNNLNIRVTPEQNQVIAQAALLKRTTINNFVLETAFEAARNIVVEQRHFTLSAEQWNDFYDALEAAPHQYPRLRNLLTEPGVFDED